MKIMVLDNYDSFTYNLVHILKELSKVSVDVHRNEEIDLKDIGKYDKIVISPGPGVPDQAGITKKMIEHFAPTKSILGVCLGCQAIAEVFGGSLINLDQVFHGVATNINVLDENERIFRGIPISFTAGRYHSWVINENNFPAGLKITAKDDKGMIMALTHLSYDVKGVQFHPESVLTGYGKQILLNWLNI
ncbi:MAG: aminodeoxychorismate/anthranilate synthase component II [Bacteroidales bacterium]|jgi:anthranilate synthase component 2|nr:aminodeoxychorismate/anthranilate synthase component II [Bacteroidales bacterium]